MTRVPSGLRTSGNRSSFWQRPYRAQHRRRSKKRTGLGSHPSAVQIARKTRKSAENVESYVRSSGFTPALLGWLTGRTVLHSSSDCVLLLAVARNHHGLLFEEMFSRAHHAPKMKRSPNQVTAPNCRQALQIDAPDSSDAAFAGSARFRRQSVSSGVSRLRDNKNHDYENTKHYYTNRSHVLRRFGSARR